MSPKAFPVPLRPIVVAGITAMWSALGLVAAMQVWFRPQPHPGLGFLTLLFVPHWAAWAGFSLAVWTIQRAVGPRGPVAVAALHVPLGAAVIAAHAAVVAWWDVVVLAGYEHVTFPRIFVNHLRTSADREALGYLVILAGALLLARRRRAVPPARATLPVRVGDTTELIPLDEISYLEAANNYARIHTPHRRLAVRQSLTSLEASLDGRFVRVHRSVVVNVDHVARLHSGGRWQKYVVLRHGPQIKASSEGWRRLRTRIHDITPAPNDWD